MRVTRTRVATLMPWLLLLALCLLPVLAFAAPGAPATPLPDVNVGKIGEDQLADMAERRGMDKAELERHLAPNL